MQRHFTFGHTIQPQQLSQKDKSDEDLADLFKIGSEKIEVQLQDACSHDSDETPRQSQLVSEKKLKKEKKQKKQKKEKKQKKQIEEKEEKQKKRGKANNKHQHSSSNQDQNQQSRSLEPKDRQAQPSKYFSQEMLLFKESSKKQVSLFKGPSGLLQSSFWEEKDVQQQLKDSSNVQFKLKLGEGLLDVDVMNFPQKQLYLYGLMEKDVPQYSRFPQKQVIGLKGGSQRKIIKQLNKMINQKIENPNKDEIAKQRYFSFHGFQKIQGQKPPSIRYQAKLASFIALATQSFSQSKEEETLLKLSRQFNSQLKKEPHNISLWLEFTSSQNKCASVVISSTKTRQAILERQLSILQRALQLNPGQQKLASCYIDTMLARQIDSSLVTQKCVQFIRSKPHCLELWSAYMKLKLGVFSLYSHEMARKVCQQILKMVKGMIDSARSAVAVWKLRRVSLQITRTICQLYRLQGYGQLSTAIIVAILQFNWFIPEDISKIGNHEQKVKAFGLYWQDSGRFKLGEVLQPLGTASIGTASIGAASIGTASIGTASIGTASIGTASIGTASIGTASIGTASIGTASIGASLRLQQPQLQKLKFIGRQPSLNFIHQNKYQQELILHQNIWRPSHAVIDCDIIKQRPQSYILIEDIDFTLANYRDNDSLMGLVDLLADHFQLPPVFTTANLQSEFTLLIVQKSFNFQQTQPKFDMFAQCGCFWWSRFWNPKKTLELFGAERIQKIQYFRRILLQIKSKIQTFNKQINAYLMFLTCCYNLNPQVRQILKLEQSEVLKQIEELLAEQTLTPKIWSIYIHSIFLLAKNADQCIQCWMQLFQSNKQMNNGISDGSINQQIFVWLWQFSKTQAPQYTSKLLKLYLLLLDDREMPKNVANIQLAENEKYRLERYFIQKIAFLLQQKGQISSQIKADNIFFLTFILDIIKRYDFANLQPFKERIITLLIDRVSTENPFSQLQYSIIHSLIDNQQLSIAKLKYTDRSRFFQYLSVVRYWIQSDISSLITYTVQFQLSQLRSLSLWMASGIFLWRRYGKQLNFHQFFYKIGIKIAEQQNNKDASYLILLNKLLIHDTKQIHTHFALESLKNCPYSKQIYLINLLISQDNGQAAKIKSLIHQKGIRILDLQAFQ